MIDRYDAIRRLLDVRYDGFPDINRRVEIASGFVHATRAPAVCPVCEGVESLGCTGCGGRGEIEQARTRDPYALDAPVVRYGLDGENHRASKERDREIARLGLQIRPASDVDEAAEADQRPWPWEIARKRLYASYHLRELERSLEALHLSFPGLSPYSDRGLAFLSDRLPDPLRAPGVEPEPHVRGPVRPEAGIATLAVRDAEMRAAANAGATLPELCARFGVSKSTVYAVVNKEAA